MLIMFTKMQEFIMLIMFIHLGIPPPIDDVY